MGSVKVTELRLRGLHTLYFDETEKKGLARCVADAKRNEVFEGTSIRIATAALYLKDRRIEDLEREVEQLRERLNDCWLTLQAEREQKG